MYIVPDSTTYLQEAVAILRSGGVVAHATETCYGLACDLSNPNAVQKLFAIKQRSEEQPVSGLFSSLTQAEQYTHWNNEAISIANEYLPGPLTIVAPLKKEAPTVLYPTIFPEHNLTVGVRVSSHPIALALVEEFGSPISTTSANIHGKNNPYSTTDIAEQFALEKCIPDIVLDSGTLPQTEASTVISIVKNEIIVLRKGALDDVRWKIGK